MPNYITFDKKTGRIFEFGSSSLEKDALAKKTGEIEVLLGLTGEPRSQYVQNGKVVDRPSASIDKTSISADGNDAATLSNLPDPCTVRINGSLHEVTGGELVITASKPADYLIEIRDNDAFPLQAFKATVGAS